MHIPLILSSLAAAVGSATASIKAVDSSVYVAEAIYKKALSEGFTRAIIRGYHEACTIGGEIDPTFISTYTNAVLAGYHDIGVYFVPCTGTTNKCKPYATQFQELFDTIHTHKMQINALWIDFEVDNLCRPWNYGNEQNLIQAREVMGAATQAVTNAGGLGHIRVGVYSSPGEWVDIFGSHDVVLDIGLPLWYANWNGKGDMSYVPKIGGWQTILGHQYTNVSASGDFDLNVFAG
jgi:hypothetical protein